VCIFAGLTRSAHSVTDLQRCWIGDSLGVLIDKHSLCADVPIARYKYGVRGYVYELKNLYIECPGDFRTDVYN
jgi:hypothetical protein